MRPPLPPRAWLPLAGALPDEAHPHPQAPSELDRLPQPTPSHARSISGDEGCQRNAARLEKLQQFIKIASCHSTPLTSTTCSHKHNSQSQGEVTKAGRWTLLPNSQSLTRPPPNPQTLHSLLSPAFPSPLDPRLVFLGWRRGNTHLAPNSIQTKGPEPLRRSKVQECTKRNRSEREKAKTGNNKTERKGL